MNAAFTTIGADFEKSHPGTMVRFSFAGSSSLAAQIQEGALGDVFASADQPNMQKLVQAGLTAESPMVFARNDLEIVVAKGNPKHIASLADLARSGLVIVLCAAAFHIGREGRTCRQALRTIVEFGDQGLNPIGAMLAERCAKGGAR